MRVIELLAVCAVTTWVYCGRPTFILASLRRPTAQGNFRQHVAMRASSDDGFIDGTFTEMTDVLVGAMFLPQQEKDAYSSYRQGMASQTAGDLRGAMVHYAAALKNEADPIDRSYILYNLGIVFATNGEFTKAVKYYSLAIDENKEMASAYNNIGVIYHTQGRKAEAEGNSERADGLFDKAAQYWNQAIRITPGNYIMQESWLLSTGRNGEWSDDPLSRYR